MEATPVFLPGQSHEQRSLGGYGLWSCIVTRAKRSSMHTHACSQMERSGRHVSDTRPAATPSGTGRGSGCCGILGSPGSSSRGSLGAGQGVGKTQTWLLTTVLRFHQRV